MAIRHGGAILAEQLKIQGVTRVFSVPGESFLAALDGLYESGIQNVVCRQEGGASMMAEAHGKLTGRPGIAFVTRGPGATNASSGLHVAMQDSTPMVLFVGQIARDHRDREAFQEVDYRQFFGGLVKWVAEVDQSERLPEYIARAFQIAMSGRPGPVVLALPEDMLSSIAEVADRPAAQVARAMPAPDDVSRILSMLAQAKRPLLIAGGPGWSAQAASDLERFAERMDLPVAVPFRRQDYLNNDSPYYAGDLGVGMNPALAKRLRDADVLLVIGARVGDILTNGYELLDPSDLGKTLIHTHPSPDEPGHVYAPDFALACDSSALIAALAEADATAGDWAEWRAQARAEYDVWQQLKATPGPVKMEQVVSWLSDTLPHDAILTNGAGNYAAFVHRYHRFRGYKTQVAPTSGSMGYGFPASIAAKLEHPDRTVICFAGDGCFQMTCNEMSTAIQHGAAVIVIVVNNGKYGTIRMHQEKTYPGRVSGTMITNPDFAALARAYGGTGQTVTRTEDFAAAFDVAQKSGVLSVIELQLDDEVLSTGMTLSETRALGQTSKSG
ncbi:thiamine pyrophosphate-binding protein [Litoreibacter janthinus]|uniref:Acetolactate synthase-1/2/3 large subunit n=1 Tax=Litoreibacter janthinus TaxID=670154 RepID=A0A1I6FTZ9_9RHOB|nr:thiamine pyrophosphate-binding protein [Litoreibacter janthinus]SFR33435.1 acetolactate synthase-1/2/3 large subunit [Litoreibacter janthinus]